jgi:hypothetical protein
MASRTLSVHPMQREALIEALRELDAGEELHVFGNPDDGDPDAWPGGQWCDGRHEAARPVVFHREVRAFGVFARALVCLACGQTDGDGEDG